MKALLIAVTLLAPAWAGDAPTPQLSCQRPGLYVSGLTTVCEMVEIPAAFSGSLNVATPVGGISVVGWDQPDVLIRAKKEAAARGQAAAENLSSQIQINVAGGMVSADGPAPQSGWDWVVTFEIFVPRATDLSLNTKVGGVSITDVKGTIRFNVSTGGVSLVRLAGDVQGSTKVGGLYIVLDGDHWDGQTLAVNTKVGGIVYRVPAGYSAHFSLSTALGKIDASYLGAFPAPSSTFSLGSNLTFDAGSGGATIASETNVGGIVIQKI